MSAISEFLSKPTSEPVLFYSPGACSMASHIALEETGEPYRPVETLLSQKQHMTPEYLAITPRGRVPALVVDGRVITENTAILTYLGLKYPQTGMYPSGTIEQVLCIAQMAWFSNTPHIFQKANFRPYYFVDREELYDDIRTKAKESYWKNMQEIDGLIAGQQWIMGERYTVVDPYALVFYNWGLGNGMPMGELKNFTRHKDQMIGRPAVRTVLEREKNTRLK